MQPVEGTGATLVATDCSSTSRTRIPPGSPAAAIADELRRTIDNDALVVADGASCFPPCARASGITHVFLDQSAGERRRGERHLDTVNSRHQRHEAALRNRRGVATRDRDRYLASYHKVILPKRPTARSTLIAVAGISVAGISVAGLTTAGTSLDRVNPN